MYFLKTQKGRKAPLQRPKGHISEYLTEEIPAETYNKEPGIVIV